MKTQLRQVGNSVGQIIPVHVLRELDLQVGDELDLVVANGSIVAKPIKNRPQYSLDELLAKCDEDTPLSDDLKAWDTMDAVGLEHDF